MVHRQLRPRLLTSFAVGLVSLVCILPSQAHADTSFDSATHLPPDPATSATIATLVNAGPNAGSVWAGLSAAQQNAVLAYLKPDFYLEGRHGTLNAVTTTVTGASNRYVAPSISRQPDDFGGNWSALNVTLVGEDDAKLAACQSNDGGTCGITWSTSVSNSWSANVGINAGAVTAGVGFDVTHTTSVTFNGTHTAPRGQTWELDAISVSDLYHYDAYWNPWGGNAQRQGDGFAEKFTNQINYVSWRVS